MEDLRTTEIQEDIHITLQDLRTGVRTMSNWKAAGPDHVQGFWFKKMTELHPRLQEFLHGGVRSGDLPEWTTKGRIMC